MMTNKDIEEFNKQLEEINKDPNYNKYPERGPADLEQRIEDLLRINVEHHNLNAELRKEIKFLQGKINHYQIMTDQLRKENDQLRNMGKDFIDEHRNKGNI
tara:strand:+ start:313 stop:615 length:303 start_codon:yes stop_codon:yes gene_type:complete